MTLSFRLNYKDVTIETSPETLLVDLLRKDFKLSGARPGCTRGQCGICSVIFNGALAPSCLLPAFKLFGSDIVTIEGFVQTRDYLDIEKGFDRAGMDPCRFCASGKVLLAHTVLMNNSNPSNTEIEKTAAGIWCRCTSYTSFYKAIQYAGEYRRRRYSSRNLGG
jgi:aerobic carbon-monoxide dehydrogenase small subunit